MENVAQENEKSIAGVIKINEKGVMDHIDGLVRKSVEDTLNVGSVKGHFRFDRICAEKRDAGEIGEVRKNARPPDIKNRFGILWA